MEREAVVLELPRVMEAKVLIIPMEAAEIVAMVNDATIIGVEEVEEIEIIIKLVSFSGRLHQSDIVRPWTKDYVSIAVHQDIM